MLTLRDKDLPPVRGAYLVKVKILFKVHLIAQQKCEYNALYS